MRRAEKRSELPVTGQVIHAVAGAGQRVHRTRQRESGHILANEARLHAPLTCLFRRAFQHFLGNIHADDPRNALGKFKRHGAGTAGAVAQGSDRPLVCAQQRHVIICPRRIIVIIHQQIIDSGKPRVRLHAPSTPYPATIPIYIVPYATRIDNKC